jgi:hypothetical protein
VNLTGLLTGVGQAGSDLAQGKLDAEQAKLKDLFDKLNLSQGKVNLAESEERLKRLQGQPKTPEEEYQQKIAAVKKFIPNASDNDIRAIFGLPPAKTALPIGNQIEEGLKALPEQQRKMVEPVIRGYMDAGEPDKALQVLGSIAEKFKPEPTDMKLVQPQGGGAPFSVQVGNETLTPKDAGWTPKMQAFLEAGVKSHQDFLKYKEDEQTKNWNRRLMLANKLAEKRDAEKLFTDFDKASKTMKQWNHLEDVAESANSYVANPTGPGDAELMLSYVQAIKPDSGFRFTTTEQKLILEKTRGIVEAAQAAYAQGTRGLLFGPAGSEQRAEIGKIVAEAAGQAGKRKDDYLSGIGKVNPKLYDILTDNNDDLEPVQ